MDGAATAAASDDASETDDSGAVAWAREVTVNGTMRSWIELTMGDCEGMLWTASLILLRHLEVKKPRGWWRGRRVLEFGSGTGHLAVGLARLGAHVVATESAESHNGALTSGFETMTSLTKRLLQQEQQQQQRAPDAAPSDERGEAPQAGGGAPPPLDDGAPIAVGSGDGAGSVTFRQLHWGLDDLVPNSWDGFEIVILSELYFEPELHEPLLQSLRRILQPGMVAFSIFVDRPFSLGFLLMLDDDGSFEVDEIALEEIFGMQEDDVIYAHVITRKSVS